MESLILSNLTQKIHQIDPLTDDETLWSQLIDGRTICRSIKSSIKELDPRSFTITGFAEAHHIAKEKSRELKPIEPFSHPKFVVEVESRFRQRIFYRQYFSDIGDLFFFTSALLVEVKDDVVFDDSPSKLEIEFDLFFPPSYESNLPITEFEIERAIRAVASTCITDTPIYQNLFEGRALYKDTDNKAKPS